jgi:hypothetical protein
LLTAAMVSVPGECLVDISDLRFADGRALRQLIDIAGQRPGARTTILASDQMCRQLILVGADTFPNLVLRRV